jgi:hypothetical protein
LTDKVYITEESFCFLELLTLLGWDVLVTNPSFGQYSFKLFEKRNLVLRQLEMGNTSIESIAANTPLTEEQVLKALRNLLRVRRINGEIEKIKGEKPTFYHYPRTNFVKTQYVLGIISLSSSLLFLVSLAWIYPAFAFGEITASFEFFLPYPTLFFATISIIGFGILISLIAIRSRRALFGLLLYILSTIIIFTTITLAYAFIGVLVGGFYALFCCYYGGI